jgi:hypothetical protein
MDEEKERQKVTEKEEKNKMKDEERYTSQLSTHGKFFPVIPLTTAVFSF